MTCECINDLNAKLAEHNTRLSMTIAFREVRGKTVGNAYPSIQTEACLKKRGQRPMVVMPDFCPWCGVKYDSDEDRT